MTATRVVVDTDTGVDDFFAIVQAFRSPELRLEALTTVGGNVPLRYATRNALRAVEHSLVGGVVRGAATPPVIPGSSRPLVGGFSYAFYFHGPGGLPARLPRPTTLSSSSKAVDFLIHRSTSPRVRRRPFTLVGLGPATNIARFLRRLKKARVRHALERIVLMGGAVDVPGNVTPFAEFNTWNDPEAAAEVLDSGIPVTLVPLDVCYPVKLGHDDFATAEPVARRLGTAWLKLHPGRELGLADCVAIAALTDPGAFRFEKIALEVDTSTGPERGRTKRAAAGVRIETAMAVDAERVLRTMRSRALGSSPSGAA